MVGAIICRFSQRVMGVEAVADAEEFDVPVVAAEGP
jgi:hypothetical protein